MPEVVIPKILLRVLDRATVNQPHNKFYSLDRIQTIGNVKFIDSEALTTLFSAVVGFIDGTKSTILFSCDGKGTQDFDLVPELKKLGFMDVTYSPSRLSSPEAPSPEGVVWVNPKTVSECTRASNVVEGERSFLVFESGDIALVSGSAEVIGKSLGLPKSCCPVSQAKKETRKPVTQATPTPPVSAPTPPPPAAIPETMPTPPPTDSPITPRYLNTVFQQKPERSSDLTQQEKRAVRIHDLLHR